MINQLPEVSSPHPPHILKTFYPLLDRYDLSTSHGFRELVADVCAWVNCNPVPWKLTMDPIEIGKRCSNRTLVDVFAAVYEAYADFNNARFWCCKSMESVSYYREIEEAGLHPVYLHMYRDGRDVALSFRKAIVGPKHIYFLAKKWRQEQELSLQITDATPAERMCVVRYEEFILNTDKTVTDICNKLGIKFNDRVHEYQQSEESMNTAKSGQMWQNVVKPVMQENTKKYEKELTEEEIKIFETVAGDMLHRLNYQTHFWPNLPDTKFTLEDIAGFKREDEELAKKVLSKATPDELERRKPQEKLLQSIKSRKVLI